MLVASCSCPRGRGSWSCRAPWPGARPTLRASARASCRTSGSGRLSAHDLGMHRAGVGARAPRTRSFMPHSGHGRAPAERPRGASGRRRPSRSPSGCAHVHLGDERERLVRLGLERSRSRRSRSAASSGFVRSCVERVASSDGSAGSSPTWIVGQPVGALGRPVLERELARPVEEDVHDDALRGRKDDRVDELLVLDAAAVAADELHPRARKGDVEHARVRGVREVEANDLPACASSARCGSPPTSMTLPNRPIAA